MRYSIGCPGPPHAGTRTLIFTTGGGGSFGKQSSAAGFATPSDSEDLENGSIVAVKSARPKTERTSIVVVFMDVGDLWTCAGPRRSRGVRGTYFIPLSIRTTALSCPNEQIAAWK